MSDRIHLADHLGPAPAPRELWTRVVAAPAAAPRSAVPSWAVAAACFLLAGAAMLSGELTPSKVSVESAIIDADPSVLELRAADGERLTGWLARQGIFDGRLGSGNGSGAGTKIRFLGARRVDTPRGPAALVFYRQGSRIVKLALMPDGSADPGAKRILSRTLTSGARLFDWHDNGQHYMMLTSRSEAAETACQVCHKA